MAPLPRATCHVCGGQVPRRVNGAAREHADEREIGTPVAGRKCAGSGLMVEEARRGPNGALKVPR